MILHGYHNLDEIAEALTVSTAWLLEELDEELDTAQFTLLGERHYFSGDIEKWINRRSEAIICEQRRMRDLANDVTPKLSIDELQKLG